MTIAEHFNTIADPEIRERAFRNARPEALGETFSSLEFSIDAAFTWSESPERHSFWSAVRHHYSKGYDSPNLFAENEYLCFEEARRRLTPTGNIYQIY